MDWCGTDSQRYDMNEHFKKHLEASYTRAFAECARTGHKVGNLDAIFNSIAMATFAELIVAECTNIVADAVDHREPASTYVNKIKQHFGVEQ